MTLHPYAEALGALDAQQVLAATPARLAALLVRLLPEQIETPPAPGKWSVREVMCHLADCEIAWAWRLRFAYEKDNAVLQPFDQDPWARAYAHYTFDQAVAAFTALRTWNNAFLAGLSEADKQKPVTHPEHGQWVLWTIAEVAAGHDRHHLAALEKIVGEA
jgi:uncharacterized damage-inducible protein DinB